MVCLVCEREIEKREIHGKPMNDFGQPFSVFFFPLFPPQYYRYEIFTAFNNDESHIIHTNLFGTQGGLFPPNQIFFIRKGMSEIKLSTTFINNSNLLPLTRIDYR
jgi:hypothetical protein